MNFKCSVCDEGWAVHKIRKIENLYVKQEGELILHYLECGQCGVEYVNSKLNDINVEEKKKFREENKNNIPLVFDFIR